MDFEVAYYRMDSKNHHFSNQIELSEELFEELNKYMNPNYNITEQIIYYYIMICKTLTYDPEFYASEQKGVPAFLHEDPGCVKKITPTNNTAVCYETAAIFEKILERYNLEYEVMKSNPHIYGQEHTCTKFIVDKFIVLGDILSHSFLNDAFYSKVGLPLHSLQCINQDEDSREEFNVMLLNVYKDINNKTLSPNMEILRDVLMKNKKCMDYNERVKMFTQLGLVATDLPMMDRFAIFKYFYLTSFTTKEMLRNFRLVVAKEIIVENRRIQGFPIMFAALNPNDMEKYPNQCFYISFDKDFKFQFYTQEALQEHFNNGRYVYLNYFDQSRQVGNYAKLPGVNKPIREY